TNYTTLANWKTANTNAYDQASVDANPTFADVNNADFTPTEVSINGMGDNVGVTTDFRDSSRTATPDPGAIEFTLPGCTSPAEAGTATSTVNTVCQNTIFTLNLTGNSVGTGINYQWQSSVNGTTGWTNMGSAVDVSIKNVTQTDTMWYRCIARCNMGTPDTSSVVQVNTAVLASGSYSINSGIPTGGSNFQSFTEAVNYIGCGVNGPVTFTIAPGGTYTEQIMIPAIAGASSTNKITFKGNLATLTFTPTDAANRHVLWLNGADHVTVDSLNVTVGGTVAGWGVVLTNQADSNTIKNCTIDVGNATSTSANFIPVVINGVANTTDTSGNNGNYNLFENNSLLNGYYGFYVYGNSASNTQNVGNIFRGNSVKDYYNYGLYGIYLRSTVISANDFSRPARTNSTTTAGVFLTTGCLGSLIEKNKINNLFDAFATSTSTAYGIYISADATTGLENRLINNLIYNFNGNGTHYGIYNTGGDSMLVYHNTIILDDANATGAGYGIYQTTAATGIQILNNIISVTRAQAGIKRCLHYNTNTSTFISNKNVLYLNAGAGTDN
ncbi:MAG: hypothetical protein ACOVOV_19025, partial [Dolichospermum sp.]